MPTPWKESSVSHKIVIQFSSNTNLLLQKLTPTNAKGILSSHHNNINGEWHALLGGPSSVGLAKSRPKSTPPQGGPHDSLGYESKCWAAFNSWFDMLMSYASVDE